MCKIFQITVVEFSKLEFGVRSKWEGIKRRDNGGGRGVGSWDWGPVGPQDGREFSAAQRVDDGGDVALGTVERGKVFLHDVEPAQRHAAGKPTAGRGFVGEEAIVFIITLPA